jgi:hypothetical protein
MLGEDDGVSVPGIRSHSPINGPNSPKSLKNVLQKKLV